MFEFGAVWAGLTSARKDITEINAASQALKKAIIDRDFDKVWKKWATVSVLGKLLASNLENMEKKTNAANDMGFCVPGASIKCKNGMIWGLTPNPRSDRMV